MKGDIYKMKMITIKRPLLDGMQGHNYGLPDCIKFIFECKGQGERFDFWDIAAVTGDTVAQIYNHNLSTRCEYCVSGYLGNAEYFQYIFDTLGYKHEYIPAKYLNANPQLCIQKIVEMIDKDIPIIVKTNINDIPGWNSDVGTYCLIVGYDQEGQIVKLLVGGTDIIDYALTDENKMDLIFIGEKQREMGIEELYVKAINKMSYWLTLPERSGVFFGASAFRAWADDIDAGRFEDDSLRLWDNYGVYVCNLATSGGEATFLFKKLADMNQEYSYLESLGEKIQKLIPTESPTGGKNLLWIQLDELDGGMNMNKVKIAMHDKEKRSQIAKVLHDYAERLDQVVELLTGNI